jgi:uncharacterized membrane protein YedE/YeeE
MQNKSIQIAKPYINPYLAAVLLGLVLFFAFFLTGNGLGASGSLNRVVIGVIDLFFPDHVNQTKSMAEIAGGDKNPFQHWIILLTCGTLMGGFLSGWANKRIRLETLKGPNISDKMRWFLAFSGGALMGFGARLARGCTSGQALSGGAVLSAGSWAFMFAVFAGAYLLAYSLRKAWN